MGNRQNLQRPLRSRIDGFSEDEVYDYKNYFESRLSEKKNHTYFLEKKKLQDQINCDTDVTDSIFEYFDVDQEFKVDSYKFINGLIRLRQSNMRVKSQIIFEIFNTEDKKSKTLGASEISKFLNTVMFTKAKLLGNPEPKFDELNNYLVQILKQMEANKNESLNLSQFFEFFENDQNVVDFLRCMGLISREDLNQKREDNDEDFKNEVNVYNSTGLDERTADIKSGITHNLNNVDTSQKEMEWVKKVQQLQPSSFQKEGASSNPPDSELQLEYVHGYRCHDTRNNLKYLPDGRLVYHTAAVGVVLDPQTNKQEFFMEHNDDILCLDVFGDLVVTGQIGFNPYLCVWQVTPSGISQKYIIRGDLQLGIKNVCFSHDGKYIAASSIDEQRHIAIYSLEGLEQDKFNPPFQGQTRKALIALSYVTKSEIFDLKFTVCGQYLLAGCNNQMLRIKINYNNKQLQSVKCIYENLTETSIMSIAFLSNEIVLGTQKGQLCLLKDNNIVMELDDAHEGQSVNSLYNSTDRSRMYSAGSDGHINVWTHGLKKLYSINIKMDMNIQSHNTSIRSVCEFKNGQFVIGTRASEIVEYNQKRSTVLNRGHFKDELWGLCVDKTQKRFYSAGEDGMVASWDIASMRQIKNIILPFPCKKIDVSDNGLYLAIGCQNGNCYILDPVTLQQKKLIQLKNGISVVRFSPKTEYLALAAGKTKNTANVNIYDASRNFELRQELKGNQSRIDFLDFSSNGKFIQTNNVSQEILYFEVATGKEAINLRNEDWAGWTCQIGWPVQGIWPPCSKGDDINTVNLNSDKEVGRSVIATGDDFGKIKLFRYPAASQNAGYCSFGGHSDQITNVIFTPSNTHLISTGGAEKSIMQWKYIKNEVQDNISYDYQEEQSQQYLSATQSHKSITEQKSTQSISQQQQVVQQDDMFEQEEINEGDQVTAFDPFKTFQKILSQQKQTKADTQPPSGNLNLQYIHGYRCFDDCRQTAKYLADGTIVFIAGAMGVVLDSKTNKQTFFGDHDDDIVSMAVHPKGQFVATGQMASKGNAKAIPLHVWNSNDKKSYSLMNKFHLRQINQCAFSPDGTKLVSTGRDDDNSLSVHDWASKTMICSSNVDKAMVTGLAWLDEQQFVTVGVTHIKFWTLNGRNVTGKRGTGGGNNFIPLTSVTTAEGVAITGNAKGGLCAWKGGSAGKPIQAHEGEVGALIYNQKEKLLYSGGKDGKVITWKVQGTSLQQVSVVCDMSPQTKNPAGVRSLDIITKEGATQQTVLIGTRGSEIWEKTGDQYELLLQGHYDGEVWGCASSPNQHQYATCGGDKTVRLWCTKTNKMLNQSEPFTNDIRAIDWSSDGQYLAVCDLKAKLYLLNPNDLSLFCEFQTKFKANSSKVDPWVEDIKFSPDSQMIVVGCHGGQSDIQIVKVFNDQLQNKEIIKANMSSALVHVDWQNDSQKIIVNQQDYMNRVFSVQAESQYDGDNAQETQTMTCKISPYTRGVFQSADYSDINSVTRSHNHKFLAVGDDDGKVNLYRYPVCFPKAPRKLYNGHSSHVTRVKFSHDDHYVYSTGGLDKCVMVWKTDFGTGEIILEEDNHEINHDNNLIQKKKIQKSKQIHKQIKDSLFEESALDVGDEFMAVKPWLGAIKEPTGYKKQSNANLKPACSLNLEYVHGYRSKDCRNNLRYVDDNTIVYHAAAVCIVHDISENNKQMVNQQKFFQKHTDDITAFAISNDLSKVATGEIGAKPWIVVWDPKSQKEIYSIQGVIKKGISALAFSPSGKLLVAAAIDDDHYMTIINLDSKQLGPITTFKGGRELILDLCWKSETEFISVGPKHFKLWNAEQMPPKGKQQEKIPLKPITSCALNVSKYILGVGDGTIEIRNGGSLEGKPLDVQQNEKGSVESIYVNSQYVVVGGSSGIVKVLDSKNCSEILRIDCKNLLQNSLHTSIRSVCLSQNNKKLLIGTYGSEIYEIVTEDAKISSSTQFKLKQCIIQAHYSPSKEGTNELWGLDPFPVGDKFVTCSDDGTLRIFSAKQRKLLKVIKTNLNENDQVIKNDVSTPLMLPENVRGRCVAVDNESKNILVGFKDGTIRKYDAETLEQTFVKKLAKEWISDIKFSPDGESVAFGSHDDHVYIYSYPSMEKKHSMKKHSSYITHLDWSECSSYLHSTCGAYELLFWDASTGQQMTKGATSLRDEKWQTFTTVLGWPVQGIFEKCWDGTDVNYVDRSHLKHPQGYHILARADDFGKVSLLKYPSIIPQSESVKGDGHSSHVPCVKWSQNDEFLYSVGGEDQCVMQWKVKFTQK